MAGLGRIQQRFNAAVLAVAALFSLAGGKTAQAKAAIAAGHPLARKYVRADPREVRTCYQGDNYAYCMGIKERARRIR